MTHKNHGQRQSHLKSVSDDTESGYVLVIVIIVIASIVSIVAIKTSLSSISHLEKSTTSLTNNTVSSSIESCFEDSLLRLNWDNSYVGDSYTLGDVNCSVVISGSGNARTINVTAIVENNTENITADVTLSPFSITKYDTQ